MTEKHRRTGLNTIAVLLVLGSCLINIKNIFTSCQVDAEYQVAMAYRLLRGDRMFSEMWEVHQTSAFFLAFFEWIFLKLTGSTTGIMIYANAVGILCKTVTAFGVWSVLRRYTDKRAAYAALLFLLNAYPKDVVLPDFANQQIWFGLLVMCCMVCHLERQALRDVRWLILGAVALCLQVLSYPSCAILWLGCCLCLWVYSEWRVRDILLFTAVCAVCGGCYLLYFMREDPALFREHIYVIWSGDETHAVGVAGRLAQYGEDMLLLLSDMKYFLPVGLCAAAAAWGSRIRPGTNVSRKDLAGSIAGWFLLFWVIGYLIHLPNEDAGTKYHFFLVYLFVEGFALAGMRCLTAQERRIFAVGQAVGISGFAATLLLSDMGFFSAVPYLIPAVCVCMLPLIRMKKAYFAVILLCAVMIFRNFIYVNGWMEVPKNFKEDSIFGATWTAQYGPVKGIRNGDGAFVADVTYQEWQDMIRDGDRVLVLGYPTIPATMYLNRNVEISVDSIISTPTYTKRLFQYWEEHPEKYPNVVIVRWYKDTPLAGEYNEVIGWLETEFDIRQAEEGEFWIYYFSDRPDGT